MLEITLGRAAPYQQTLDVLASFASGRKQCVAIFVLGLLRLGTSFHHTTGDEEVFKSNYSSPAVTVRSAMGGSLSIVHNT